MKNHDSVFETLDPMFVIQAFAVYGAILAVSLAAVIIAGIIEHLKTRLYR